MENRNLISLSGLWINKAKDGSTYMSGMLNGKIKILLFKNTKKRPDSQDPDYNLCLAPHEPKDIWKAKSSDEKKESLNEDDLPF